VLARRGCGTIPANARRTARSTSKLRFYAIADNLDRVSKLPGRFPAASLFAFAFLARAVLADTVTLDRAPYTNFESPQTNPIRLSPDGSRLFSANTAANRVSVFSLTNPSAPALLKEIQVGVEPVSIWPVSNDEVWVVNHVSDSVSVVSVSHGIVTDTFPAGDEPCDVVVAGVTPRAYVTAARSNQVRVFDLATHGLVATIPLAGEHPRALAVSADGSKVYAAFALSGNGTTIWSRFAIPAPPVQPPPTNPALTTPPNVSKIFDATDPNYSKVAGYKMLDHDVVEIDAQSQQVSRYFDTVGTLNLGLAVRPTNGDLYVTNTDARNRLRFLENLRGHLVDNRITRITTGATPSVEAVDLNPGIDFAVLPNPTALNTALAQPTSVVFDPSGNFMWIAAFGTDRIAKVDPNGVVLARIEVGNVTGAAADPANKRGPRALALNANANRLYVQNRISNTITVIDTSNNAVAGEVRVGSNDPAPLAVRQGRGFFYDAKLSGNGTLSCASCHLDGQTDNLAWDLGNRAGEMLTTVDPLTGQSFSIHPMKGPLLTQTLAGLKDFAPYHWRGDMPNLSAFSINFDILMGGSQIASADMQKLVEFMKSITHMPNPNQNLDRSLPTNLNGGNANDGLAQFQRVPNPRGDSVSCSSCHALPTLPFQPRITPADNHTPPFARKVPTLRQVYKKAGFSFDAAENTMGFGMACDGTLTPDPGVENASFLAFQSSWDTGTAPAVGAMRMLTSATANSSALATDWSTLEARVAAGDCDVVVQGEIDGVVRSLTYSAADGLYRGNAADVGPFTRAQLVAKAQTGAATLTIMGAAPGNAGPFPAVLQNISSRLRVQPDPNGLIAGFIVTGSVPKKVMIRAIGPSLARFSIQGFLPDPMLELHDSNQLIGTNNNWRTTQLGGIITTDQVADIQASGIAPSHDLEAAIVATLEPNQGYTAIVRGDGLATGMAVVEVFDLSGAADAALGNISTRGFVQTGDDIMIAGFIVGANSSGNGKTVVLAKGPSLSQFIPGSVISDSVLDLRDSNGTTVASNDNWGDTQRADIEHTHLQPSNELESGIMIALPPGAYTALVSGKNGGTGVGLVEVYAAP
jgi:YVTN family beta-propeller protein